MTAQTFKPQAETAKFNLILAPTEGSDSEKRALSVAIRLARRHGARLHLLRVEATPYAIEPLQRRGNDGNETAERNLSRDELEVLAAACRAAAHIPVVSSFETGPVGRTIAEYAKKSGADLIVMASHARGGRKRAALGSVTEYVVRKTNLPVLVVKNGATFVGPTVAESFSTIVIPLDGSPLSERVIPEAKKLAKVLGSTVRLVHVMTPLTYSQEQIAEPLLPWWEEDIGAARDYLDKIAAEFTEDGIQAATDVLLNDDIPSTILDFTDRIGADIIAIATIGSGGTSRFVFGSVANEITRRAQVSLLAFHPAEGQSNARLEEGALSHSVLEV